MNGYRIFDCFEKTYKITKRNKLKISGHFANLFEGDMIHIQMWPGDSKLKITTYHGLDQNTFEVYAGNIRRGLENFELEEM